MMNSPVPPPGSKVLILGRFSSDMQNPLSAENQIQLCRAKCEQLGWIVKGVFKDEAKSGRSVVSRTGYLEMMATAEAEAVDAIVATSLDRIGRNARELHDARNRLGDVDAVIYTLDRGVMGRMEFAIFAEWAQMESEKIGQRSLSGRRASAERGNIVGDIPYGWRSIRTPDGRTVEIDPVTSPILLRVNEDYAAGISPPRICANLIREGIPTPKGEKIWHPATILGTKGEMNGLLRNPMNIGKVYFGKTKGSYNHKTGKYLRGRGSAADMKVVDAPWLRIISDELWQKVQDRVEERTFTTLRDSRHPDYLLTGLIKCAVCGGSYTMTTAKLGCSNRRVQACDNGRRVAREDLENVVIEGLRGRIAQAHVIEWFLPEYLEEMERAAREAEDREAIRQGRREAVGREIDNLIKQLRAGAGDFAAKLINSELEALGREREQLDRELRAHRPAQAPAGINPDLVVERLNALLDELGAALNGKERDATRARDIVRSFITKIVITPMDSEGRQDRRGCGPVRVTVEGAISTLVDQALLDRKIMHKPSSPHVHGLPTATFRYYVDLDRRLSETQEGIFADQAILARLLEEADFPMRRPELLAGLNELGREPVGDEVDVLERRLACALRYLQTNEWVRAVRRGKEVGWVWNGQNVSDAEWRERLRDPAGYTPPISVVRFTPPKAFVVVVEHRRDGEEPCGPDAPSDEPDIGLGR